MTTDAEKEPSFEQALARLEAIVHELEDGDVGLAEALSSYETGVKLLRQCHGLLERAERRIELLTRVDASGEATVEPLDDSATFSGSAANSGSGKRRRTAENAADATLPGKAVKRKPPPPVDDKFGKSNIDDSEGLF